MKYKIALVLTILISSFLLVRHLVLAQEAIGIAISPPTFEISANPGETIANRIKVQNLTDKPLGITVDRRNFTALGEEGAVGLTEEETPFSLAAWISVSPSEAEIPAKSTAVFAFTIDIPTNAEPGGHFGSIVFQTRGKIPKGQTGAAVSQEIGALVLLRLAGDTTEKAAIESFKAKKFFVEYGPVEFEARVKNQGNVHIKPTGTITVSNIFGKKVASFAVEPRNVLPDAIRKIPATWERKFLFGKYTATASLVYGSQNESLTASAAFIGFPYRVAGGVLLVLIIVGILVYRRRKRVGQALRVLFGR